MSNPSDDPISITASPAVWLAIGRDLGAAKRTMSRLQEVIDEGHDGSDEGIRIFLRRLEHLSFSGEQWLDEARSRWANLIEHQASDLPDDATGRP